MVFLLSQATSSAIQSTKPVQIVQTVQSLRSVQIVIKNFDKTFFNLRVLRVFVVKSIFSAVPPGLITPMKLSAAAPSVKRA
jgi:hypothetical protein